jgi:hypothetical protein
LLLYFSNNTISVVVATLWNNNYINPRVIFTI